MTVRTPVAQDLAARIAREGPLPLDVVMATATDAYYARGDVFGAAGDFTTAPEISQVFGELIGLWCAVTWQRLGSPAPFRLVECGPGRGTLMADALRAVARVPGFLDAAEIHLIERSPALRARQRTALPDRRLSWHDDVSDVPAGPMILIANEFLDALPIKQFIRADGGWMERHVDARDGQFVFVDRAGAPASPPDLPIGSVVEQSPQTLAFVDTIARRIAQESGAAVIVDYGYVGPATGDTLQAVKAHRFHPVLEDLGAADITAHVDFGAVADTARIAGARVIGPVAQGTWLAQLGLGVRVAQLTRGKPAMEAAAIAAAAKRLSAPDAMGLLFKVMAIVHPSLATADGFAQDAAP